jgi:hypothetical protein
MSFEAYPTKIEIYDDHGFHVANIQVQDAAVATIDIKLGTTASEWPELSDTILKALKMCKLEGDE